MIWQASDTIKLRPNLEAGEALSRIAELLQPEQREAVVVTERSLSFELPIWKMLIRDWRNFNGVDRGIFQLDAYDDALRLSYTLGRFHAAVAVLAFATLVLIAGTSRSGLVTGMIYSAVVALIFWAAMKWQFWLEKRELRRVLA